MSNEELKNSPLHGLSTDTMLTELVEFYGWAVLDAAIDLKCFRIRPTVPSALTFLKRAEWARNRVEDFYLYSFKQMPRGSAEEMELPPRKRGFPAGVKPKGPKPLTLKQAEKERMMLSCEDQIEKRKPVVQQQERCKDEALSPSEGGFKSRFSDSPFRKNH
ncbi:MAG TPA: VF530 family DNA-binding protein [Pontiella sp.]